MFFTYYWVVFFCRTERPSFSTGVKLKNLVLLWSSAFVSGVQSWNDYNDWDEREKKESWQFCGLFYSELAFPACVEDDKHLECKRPFLPHPYMHLEGDFVRSYRPKKVLHTYFYALQVRRCIWWDVKHVEQLPGLPGGSHTQCCQWIFTNTSVLFLKRGSLRCILLNALDWFREMRV